MTDKTTVISSLCIAFDNKFDYETINNLLAQQEGNTEKVVDILLNKIIGQKVEQEEVCLIDKEEDKPKIEEHIEQNSLFSSVLNEIDISQSTLTVIQQVGKTAQNQDKDKNYTNLEENNVKFFQERIESLSHQLEDAIRQKSKTEEEKRKALKWCVAQTDLMKNDIKQKEEQLEIMNKELQKLRKMTIDQPQNNIENYFIETKSKIIEGLENLNHQINENIVKKVQQEFIGNDNNEDKEWVIVTKTIQKLQDLAVDIKKEFLELIKPLSITQSQSRDLQESWKAEKVGLENYIKNLEQRLSKYENIYQNSSSLPPPPYYSDPNSITKL